MKSFRQVTDVMSAPRILGSAVKLAHLMVSRAIEAGDTVIDATAGNGHDTLFLAELVGPTGQVYAFDIQEAALANTRQRLSEAGLAAKLIHSGHQELREHVAGPVAAVMFNLGYLPGGDHRLVTAPETTCQALTQALSLLRPRGLVCLVVYPGHQGGGEEARAVSEFASRLSQAEYTVVRTDFINRPKHSPFILVIEKNMETADS